MPTFGAYETVTELSRGALCTLWTARRSAGAAAGTENQVGAAVYALKLCQPDVDILGVEQAQRSVEIFLEQVDVQRRLAGLPNSVWAPIHEAGRADAGGAGAFYVTDHYPRTSLERLITSRARPDPKVLSAVVAGTLAGIRQIRDFLRRPHGNLHAGNILVVTGDSGTRVLLTDPAAQSQLKGQTEVTSDLRALGAILYQLVTHQEHHERSGWPVADSPHWKRVPGGEKWRALCNRLLDPNPTSPPTVEEIEQTLVNISPAGGGISKKALIGAGVAAVVLIGAVGGYIATRPPPPPPVIPTIPPSEQWVKLVEEYEDWFAAFAGDLDRQASKVKALEERSPEFKDWLDSLRDLGKDNPWDIAGVRRSIDLSTLKREPPAAVGEPESAQAITRLLNVMTSIKSGVSGRNWNLAREGADLSARWRSLGWEAGAKQIDDALANVKADKSLIGEASAYMGVLDKAKEVDAAWVRAGVIVAKIDDATKKLGGDPVLGSFSEWARVYPAKVAAAGTDPVLKGLADGVEKVRATGAGLVAFLDHPDRKNVCFDKLAESEFYKKFSLASAEPQTFQDWTNEARLPVYANPSPADDPRAGHDLIAMTDKLAAELDGLKKNELEPVPESLSALDMLVAELGVVGVSAGADVRTKLDAVRARAKEIAELAWDCRTRDVIERIRYDTVQNHANAVARAWGKQNRDAGVADLAALEQLGKNDAPTRAASVNAWWVAQRAVVFREPDERTRREKATDLLERVIDLDASVPHWEAPADARQIEWLRNLSRVAGQERDRLLGAFLSKLDASSTWTEADERAVAESFSTWTASMEKVANAALAAERLMDAGYGLDDPPPGDAKTVRALAEEAKGAPPVVASAIAPVMTRVAALEELDRATSPAQLASHVRADAAITPELVLSAWTALGKSGSWPAAMADLDREVGEFNVALRGALRTIEEEGSAARRDELAARIGAERRARWESFVRRARTEADLERALGQDPVRAMEVDLAKVTDPLVKYRIGVHELKRAVSAAGAGDEQVKAAVTRFVESVPPDLPGDGRERLAPLLEQMRAAVSGEETGPPPVDPTILGPGSLPGWVGKIEETPDGRALLSFAKGSLRLDFLRVEPGPGVPDPVFIGVDEVTLGQFVDIIDSAEGSPGWSTVLALMPSAQDDLEAPKAWKWGATRGADKIGPVAEWIQTNRPSVGVGRGQAPAYAPGFARPDGKQIIQRMAPSPASPMQFVSPGAAVYAAAIVKCRLPTVAEWKLIAQAGPPAEGTPNLRDQTWKTQRDYIIETRKRVAGSEQFVFPDAEAFLADGVPHSEDATVAPNAADDGWLWFEPAIEGARTFAHVRGNVWELVFNGAPEEPASADQAGVRDLLRRRLRELSVIGGSALSPPEMPMEAPVPVIDSLVGYSDVGFRLAFTATGTAAPQRSMGEIVLGIMTDPASDPFLFK